jgi:succinoglycan biosynthesis protein ExoA
MTAVSIIVPCYNEEKTIRLLLQAIHEQTFPLRDLEVIIADGMSEDGTRAEIDRFKSSHPDLAIRVVNNQPRAIPSALNLAIRAAKGEFIVRMDAHSKPEPTYVEQSIQDLLQGQGDNVGGVWQIEPGSTGRMAKAISLAAAHPLGVGDALYRYAKEPGEVDTVPFGAFRRQLVDEIGGYDESLPINEDYEFNARIRQRGGKIWLDPRIRSVYFARGTLKGLSRQYWRYGFWKFQMLKRYPGTLRYRQALPPVFLCSILALALLAPFWRLAVFGLLAEVVLYIGIMTIASIPQARKYKDVGLLLAIPLAIATMHISWGGGFLASIFSRRKNRA